MCLSSVLNFLINEAQERIIQLGKWKDTYAKYRFCAYQNCITLPYELETMLTAAICCRPISIQNQWFQFLASGPGLATTTSGCGNIYDSSDGFVTVQDPCSDFTIRVYADVTEDADASITVMGLDGDGNLIRTLVDSVWQTGETIPIDASAFQTSTKTFSQVTQIVKPRTNGNIRLYANYTDGSGQVLLGIYGYNVTLPKFRRYFLPGTIDTDNPRQFTIIAKRRYIPAVDDNDLLIVQNVPAVKEMVMSILARERNDVALAQYHFSESMRCLTAELKEYLGQGGTMNMQFVNSPGAVCQRY